MIKFELADPKGNNSEDAVVYIPGQDYVMFNNIQWHLDRVLKDVSEEWIGCLFDAGLTISFIQKSVAGVITTHSAKIVMPRQLSENISSMRLRQAAKLLSAVKRVSGAMKDAIRLMRSLDDEMEQEGMGDAKLAMHEFIQGNRKAVSFQTMKKTLRMVENEAVEIMHKELDLPPLKKHKH